MRRVHGPGMPDPRSILVVLPTWVGDFVMATPILRAIRIRFDQSHIAFLHEPNLRDLIRGGDWMDECIERPVRRGIHPARTPVGEEASRRRKPAAQEGLQPARSIFQRDFRDFVWDLRRRRFDWAVLLPNSFRSALLARLAGAKRRIGYDRDGRGFLLTDRLPVKNRRKHGEGAPARPKVIGSALPHGPLPKEQGHNGGLIARNQNADVSGPRQPPPQSPPGEAGSRSVATTGVHTEQGPSHEAETRRFRPDAPVRMGSKLPVPPGRFEPMPLVEYYADLAEAIGCDRPGDRLELFTTADCDVSVDRRLESLGLAHRHPIVVISPGARYGAAKCWIPERFAAVGDRLVESEGAVVIITCGPGEEGIARQIGSAMRREAFVYDAPRLSLGEMKSLVRRSDLLLCNDAGPRHFAKAFDIPVVTIFGPTHPQWTATCYEFERIVRVDVECGPCQQRTCPLGQVQCMMDVTVGMVLEACCELLEQRKPKAGTAKQSAHRF